MQVARVEGFVAWEKCLLCETRFRFPAVCQWSSKKKKKIENVILLWKGIRGSSDWHGTRDFHRIPVIWIAQARQRHSSSTQYYYVIDSFLCWRWRGAQAPDGQRRFTASFFFSIHPRRLLFSLKHIKLKNTSCFCLYVKSNRCAEEWVYGCQQVCFTKYRYIDFRSALNHSNDMREICWKNRMETREKSATCGFLILHSFTFVHGTIKNFYCFCVTSMF